MDRVFHIQQGGNPFKALQSLKGVKSFVKVGNTAIFFLGRVGFLVCVERQTVTLMTACSAPKLRDWRAIQRVDEALR